METIEQAPLAQRLRMLPRPTARELSDLANSQSYARAATLLDKVDLGAEAAPDWLYYAGVCLGGARRLEPAIDLLKRAAAGKFAPFWCAYHLGQFEILRGRTAPAAFYLSLSLLLKPEQADDLTPLLARVVPTVIAPSLGDAQVHSATASAEAAAAMGKAARDAGNVGAAVHYFTVALAWDPDRAALRSDLLELAPDIEPALLPARRSESDQSLAILVKVEIDLDRLVKGSVLEELRERAPSRLAQVDFGPTRSPIEVAAVEIVYVPNLSLQIWEGRLVPKEVNPDCADPIEEGLQRLRDGEPRVLSGNHREVCEPTCILANLYSPNFFHFVEELCKVAVLEQFGFGGLYVIDEHFMREFLRLLGIADERIIVCGAPTLFRSAYLTTPMVAQDPLNYPGVFRWVRDRLTAAANGPSLGERLWVERRGWRVVVNSNEVDEVLARHRFTVVDMAELSLNEQIAAAKQARVFGGPHGAGFLHPLFMPEQSAVIECFSPEHVNPAIVEICQLLKHRWFPVLPMHTSFLPYRHGLDVEVPCNQLELILRNLDET